MFYISLESVAKKYSNKLAVNKLTYGQFMDKSLNRVYKLISESSGSDILLDLVNASFYNKPLVVLPKTNKGNVILPNNLPNSFCLVLYSSGSTGNRKPIIITEHMILANIKNILEFNNFTADDRILTVCSLNHTAGLTCQTLSGLFAGSSIIIEPFNAFNIIRLLKEHSITITHVVPLMTDATMKVSDKTHLPNLRLVWIGSDCIKLKHVNYWLSSNTDVMTVYGMTEAGPPTIAQIFNSKDDLSIFNDGYPVGNKIFCDYKIIDDELFLKGDIVNTPNWLQTNDCFKIVNGVFYYTGRKSAGNKIVPKGVN